MDIPEALNADFIDAQYRKWRSDPESVSRDWRFFFAGFRMAGAAGDGPAAGDGKDRALLQSKVEALKYRYRDLGHLLACMDPLEACPTGHPLLDIGAFGLGPEDLDRPFFTRRFAEDAEARRAPLREIVKQLRETYCRSIGVEYMHLQDPDERRWLEDRMEPVRNRPSLDGRTKRRILETLQQGAAFEQFLNRKYVAVTRFSLEGGDAVLPLLDFLTDHVAARGCREIVLGMAHRGRLNVQTRILGKTYEEIFGEFENCYDPGDLVGSGDVKYHNGYLADVRTFNGHDLRIYLVNNPSHLEAVDPVVEGIARARQDLAGGEAAADRVLPFLIHGDAAFAGQGVVFETLNMSQLNGYRTGGTIHLIINNQIGYTTLPADARSTRYATDGAKMLMVPIFHVHGENPEAVIHVARLAADYRQAFKKDVVIDLVCYRRYGHNEGDEPYFTQPRMVDRIRERPPLHRLYADALIEEGEADADEVKAAEKAAEEALDRAYEEVHDSSCPFPETRFYENWEGYHGDTGEPPADTGVPRKRLESLAEGLSRIPESFSLNKKLKGLLDKRLKSVREGKGIDWANAEALAFASLVTEGTAVRLSGQDSGRGTFSQRHATLVDTRTGDLHTPLDHLDGEQARFQVFNSLLAEYAVLGFEYGYSTARPDALTLWEAQFGDFVNNAQAIIDLFIASGEAKWQRLSGLVLLLPHGYEGLGPEHSSARPERFLQLCAGDNIQVCNASTPAQYFHLLRRQVKRSLRKPLVVLTPKSLLRHPMAVSDLDALSRGRFMEVIDDPWSTRTVRKVILCSGKIYYELLQRQQDLKKKACAIVRLEQFYPFPEKPLEKLVAKYGKAGRWCWVQEEPANMGGWSFVRARLEALTGKTPDYVGRPAASSPATGFPALYRRDQAAIADQALGPVS